MSNTKYFKVGIEAIPKNNELHKKPGMALLQHPDLIITYNSIAFPELDNYISGVVVKYVHIYVNHKDYRPESKGYNSYIYDSNIGLVPIIRVHTPSEKALKTPLHYIHKGLYSSYNPSVKSLYIDTDEGGKATSYGGQNNQFLSIKIDAVKKHEDMLVVYLSFNVHTHTRRTNITEVTPAVPEKYEFDKYLIPDDKGKVWSLPKTKQATFARTYLKEQIRARYGFFNRPSNGLSNVVIDSYYPGLLYANDCLAEKVLTTTTLPKTAVAISEFIANAMNVKRIPTEQLCKVLGYSSRQIKDLLVKTKKRDLTMIFAGAGGTGVNTAYWLKEMTEMTNTVNLFKKVHVYENDSIEFSNILRFPVDIRKYFSSIGDYTIHTDNTKLELMQHLIKPLSKNTIGLHNNYITNYNSIEWELRTSNKLNSDVFIYGAPELAYRNPLSEIGNFICATHAATTCSIWLNPKQELDVQVESYGMIQLGGFFMNQLKMAITLLELLANETNLTQEDISVLEYEFNGTLIGTPDRQYNWQIDRNLLMMTEEQANNI